MPETAGALFSGVESMQKRPFLMAMLILGAIFLFFLLLVLVISSFMGSTASLPIGEKVGVVRIEGVITSSRETIKEIIAFRKDSSVKAIVLRVDSPGGGVGPSQEIYQEIKKTNEIKPVVVSMGSVAASGGYYVSAPAQQIIANGGSITGSIGVIMEFTNFQELLDKIGLKSQVVKSGEHKDIGSPVRPMTPEDRKILQNLIDDVHLQFMKAVAEGRKMDLEKVRAIADGRIFTGRKARELGLVDTLGNMQTAIEVAADLAGIEGEPRVVYPPEGKKKLIEYFIEETASHFRRGLQQQTSGLQFLWSDVE